MKKYKYDIKKFPFREIISESLKVSSNDLEKLHLLSEKYDVPDAPGKDQGTKWHRAFYSYCDENKYFDETYKMFIRDYIHRLYSHEKIVYQVRPTFRVHLVGNKSVARWHRDSDDIYNHSIFETNYTIPVTRMYGNNSIWIESYPHCKDLHPMLLNHGEFMEFSAATLEHGNQVNDTNSTRISFDFRVIPFRLYKEDSRVSVKTGKKLSIGEYFTDVIE